MWVELCQSRLISNSLGFIKRQSGERESGERESGERESGERESCKRESGEIRKGVRGCRSNSINRSISNGSEVMQR